MKAVNIIQPDTRLKKIIEDLGSLYEILEVIISPRFKINIKLKNGIKHVADLSRTEIKIIGQTVARFR